MNKFFSTQPKYDEKPEKLNARKAFIDIYRQITGNHSIPKNLGYWTLCNWQDNTPGSEIVQLTQMGLLDKNQFFGIDYDRKKEGIINFNRKQHPEANWFEGDWLEVIDNHYNIFKPAIVYFDYTKTITTTALHICLARTMNLCPEGTFVAANLMLSDGHSSRRFDPNFLIDNLSKHIRSSGWILACDKYYSYKSSRTHMGTYIFMRNK